MKLHLLGLPHTITDDSHSHCAFTGKIQRFSPMMRAEGFHVVHYGVAGAESGADEQVDVMDQAEHLQLMGLERYHEKPQKLIGDYAQEASAVYRQFNMYLRDELLERVEPGDVICLPFGRAHEAATASLPLVKSGEVMRVETGIGYSEPCTFTRVFESEAWRHWTWGREQRDGAGWKTPRMEWVIPNYYDVNDWPLVLRPDANAMNTVVYLGRIEDVKGLAIVPVLAAKRPDLHFVICGQGDPTPYLTQPNIEYREPISGRDRATFIGNARCLLAPSRFIEPFCGVAVEAMLCGTPVLTSDLGAFTETVLQGETGLRCLSERNWIDGLDAVLDISRVKARYHAVRRYSLQAVGPRYTGVFDMVALRIAENRERILASVRAQGEHATA